MTDIVKFRMGYENICEKLDDLALEILNVMQAILQERQYLDDNLREGFINMAKSRYLMNGQKINTFQINSAKLRSSVAVTEDSEVVCGVKFTSFGISNTVRSSNRPSKPTFHSNTENIMHDIKKDNLCFPGESTDTVTDNSHENCSFDSSENPLHWFGVLVPDSLKNCQSRFQQVIVTSAKIASLQNQLKVLGQEYGKLKKEKYASKESN